MIYQCKYSYFQLKTNLYSKLFYFCNRIDDLNTFCSYINILHSNILRWQRLYSLHNIVATR